MRMRKLMERQFPDQAQVGTIGDTGWGSAPGSDTYTYDVVNVIPCKVDEGQTQSSFETANGGETEFGDVTIFAPAANTSITLQSRLKVTRRWRQALATNEIFRVIGINEEDSARMVFAKRVTGNAVR